MSESKWQYTLSSMALSLHGTQGVISLHIFPSHLTHTSDVIESEQLHHMCSLPGSLIMSHCIPLPTVCVWQCIISFPGILINRVSIFHPGMTNSMWVMTLLYFFARQSYQPCLIPQPTVCEWHCQCISVPGSLIHHVLSHYQQEVSNSA